MVSLHCSKKGGWKEGRRRRRRAYLRKHSWSTVGGKVGRGKKNSEVLDGEKGAKRTGETGVIIIFFLTFFVHLFILLIIHLILK